MNNEPVAWTVCLGCGQRVTGDSIHTCSPQFKTLTDEEILKVYWNMQISIETHEGVFAFAKAILRKAQEK